MDVVAEDLKKRTKRFAVAIIDYVESLPRTVTGDGLGRQLLRSGLGVVGNYRGACRGRSHAEFTARLGVVLEEVDESELWLDILNERDLGHSESRTCLLDESRELLAIFSKACITARSHGKRRF